jgi:hypothetical protein
MTAQTIMEAITGVAGLVSNAAAIDPVLDTMRSVSSKLNADESPSAADEGKLIDVYLDVEGYLISKEPIRAFTRAQLRARLAPDLLVKIEDRETKIGKERTE